MDQMPPQPHRDGPIDLPPTPDASPSELSPSFADDVPFWMPGWSDVAKQLGWRWLLLMPAVVLVAACVLLLAAAVLLPGLWLWQWVQLIFVGGWKLLLLAVGGAISLAGSAIRSAVRLRQEPFCIHCGYTLIGLPDNYICPECGRPYSLRVIDEYRRDPHWFIQRYKAHRTMPVADTPFPAGPTSKPKSRDGT